MLNPEDRRAIDGLFERLKDVEARNARRDHEAEALIRRRIAESPGAPYYMAQTVLVQEHALRVAEQRIAELEQQVQERPSGGFLDGLLGNGGRQAQGTQVQRGTRGARGPWGPIENPAPQNAQQPYPNAYPQPYGYGYGGFGGGFGGGGFLAGAAQTAMGVAGGVLLGHAIADMFDGNQAQAAEVPVGGHDAGQAFGNDTADHSSPPFDNDQGSDFGNDAGGDFGGDAGGSDFDTGGGF